MSIVFPRISQGSYFRGVPTFILAKEIFLLSAQRGSAAHSVRYAWRRSVAFATPVTSAIRLHDNPCENRRCTFREIKLALR